MCIRDSPKACGVAVENDVTHLRREVLVGDESIMCLVGIPELFDIRNQPWVLGCGSAVLRCSVLRSVVLLCAVVVGGTIGSRILGRIKDRNTRGREQE